MTVLLTGASGFLGGALARHWSRAGLPVVALLRRSSSLRRLEGLQADVRVVRADSDAEIAAAVRSAAPTAVVHAACSYGRSGESATTVLDANVRLGVVILDAMRGMPRGPSFFHVGTPLPPQTGLYAFSKHQFAEWGRRLAGGENWTFVDLHVQQMYGPDDDESKFVTRLARTFLRDEESVALTAGTQRRDFVGVQDVVSAIDLLVRLGPGRPMAAHVDIGSGHAHAVRHVVERLHALTGSRTRLDFGALPLREGEPEELKADTRFLRELGWAPETDLDSGLSHVVAAERTGPWT